MNILKFIFKVDRYRPRNRSIEPSTPSVLLLGHESGPWTDWKGGQLKFSKALKVWSAFHDRPPDTSNNKILKVNCGIISQTHPYGRDKDLCYSLGEDAIAFDKIVLEIVNKVHKKEQLSVFICASAEL